MQNDDQPSGAILVFAFLGALAWVAFALVAAVILVAAVFFTLVAFAAWNKPLPLWGQVLQPHEARAFVRNGLIGAILVPITLTLAASFMGIPVYGHHLWYMAIGGYAFGSVVVAYWVEQARVEAEATAARAQFLLSQQHLPSAAQTIENEPTAPQILPSPPREPFRFAIWDDEEELRK